MAFPTKNTCKLKNKQKQILGNNGVTDISNKLLIYMVMSQIQSELQQQNIVICI